MKGYKGMKSDMTCRGMKFEVGKTYHIDGNIEICSNGLHFCQKLADVFSYYDDVDDRYFEVETDSEVKTDGNKSVTAELKIIREIVGVELNRIKYGNGNGYGDGNGNGNGYGDGDGNGNGYGDGNGNGNGNGYGDGYGYGDGDGNGNGYGDGNGNGYGDGYGYGYDKNIQKIAKFNN